MEWAAWNTIDYSPVPTDIRKFLTAAEIENRQRVHRTAFDEICYGSEYVESASVSRMLEIRAARICDKLRSSSKTSSGCLAMLVALAGVVCYTFWADKNWLIPLIVSLQNVQGKRRRGCGLSWCSTTICSRFSIGWTVLLL